MAYALAHSICIPKSILFSPNLASARVRQTPAFSWVTWSTLLVPAVPATSLPLALGLYVNNFVYFSENPVVKQKCEALLSQLITIKFMGMVEWFLGMHFQWLATDDVVSVHLSQTGFATHLIKDSNIHTRNVTPNALPYCSGLPIDKIPELDEANNCLTLIEQKRKYHSVVSLIGWLAQSTRPNLAPTHSFLSAYCNKLSKGHWNAALYTLHYIHSTIDCRFTFTLQSRAPLPTFMSFPPPSDTKAYHRHTASQTRLTSLSLHI